MDGPVPSLSLSAGPKGDSPEELTLFSRDHHPQLTQRHRAHPEGPKASMGHPRNGAFRAFPCFVSLSELIHGARTRIKPSCRSQVSKSSREAHVSWRTSSSSTRNTRTLSSCESCPLHLPSLLGTIHIQNLAALQNYAKVNSSESHRVL